MFDIHLAWSPIQFLIVFVIQISFVVYLMTVFNKNKSKVALGGIVGIILTAFVAFDVGTPQQNLNRSKFNATISNEETAKQESGRVTVDDVKATFEQSVKQTEGN